MKLRKMFAVLLVLFLAVAWLSPVAFADGYDFAYKRQGELGTLTETVSGDKLLVWDASANEGKTMDIATGILAVGSRNGASTVASTSTALAPSSLPYTILLKAIGESGNADSADGGTRLQDGAPGQVIVFKAVALESGGTWIITPTTAYGFTSVTFDAVGDQVTLQFVNSTVGWIITASTSLTITVPVLVDGFPGE